MRVTMDGALGAGVSAKDLALALIGRIGAGAKYAGAAVRAMAMAARMTLCNMSIDAGSRTGLVAPRMRRPSPGSRAGR